MKLPQGYYQNLDVLFLGRDLIGKFLMTYFDGVTTGGMIVETESYCGPEDRASHAFGNRRTKRNEIMYSSGGFAYVYRCYGIHALFNVVTGSLDIPHAILVRSVKPLIGVEEMIKRRKGRKNIASGPGNLTQALGIDTIHNGISLTGDKIWIEERGVKLPPKKILATPRIGVDYAGEDAYKPWRYILVDYL